MSCSYEKNRALRAEIAQIVVRAQARGTIEDLEDLRAHVELLRAWNENGPPLSYRWGMYAGKDLYASSRAAYLAILSDRFARPVKAQLEDELRAIAGKGAPAEEDAYNADFDRLRIYLGGCGVRALSIDEESRAVASALHTSADAIPLIKDCLEAPAWTCDDGLIRAVREKLTQVPPLDRAFYGVIRDANAQLPRITRRSVFDHTAVESYVTSKSSPEHVVKGAFTRTGWDTFVVYGLGIGRAKELTLEERVLGEKATLSPRDDAELRDRYFNKFIGAWGDFLKDLQIRQPTSYDEALDELKVLSAAPGPYLDLLRLVDDNTSLEEEPFPIAQSPLPLPKWQSPPERAFQPIVRFGRRSGPKTVPLFEYHDRIVPKVVRFLTDLRDGKIPKADDKAVLAVFEAATTATNELLSPTQNGFTRPLLASLLLDPFRLEEARAKKAAMGTPQGDWEAAVWEKWHDQLEGSYPFADSWRDAKLPEYTAFLRPGGVLFGYEHTLDPHRSAALLACYARGYEIAGATFPSGEAEPRVELELNLHGVSAGVTEVSLDIDGAHQSYTTAPGPWLAVTWPAKSPAMQSILKVKGADGLDEEMLRPGEWGLFRLLDAATKIESGMPSTFVVTWALRSRSGFVKMDLRSKTNEKLFASYVARGGRLFAPYTCPRALASR
jgi:type VI secretion system protein ImpL